MKNTRIIQFLFISFLILVITGCCEEKVWYRDIDGDGLGDSDDFIESCEQPNGYVDNGNDPSPLINLSFGDSYEGSYIFYIDETGEHGKVMYGQDLHGNFDDFFDWQSAMEECEMFGNGGHSDWYLPSQAEWSLVGSRLFSHFDDFTPINLDGEYVYWSSTEDGDTAWAQGFGFILGASPGYYTKTSEQLVRPVRAF